MRAHFQNTQDAGTAKLRPFLLAVLLAQSLPALAAAPISAPAAAAGAAAAATVPALDPKVCDGKPVIMVVRGTLKDRARLAQYAAAIRASGLYPILGGYYLNVPRAVAVFEGTPDPNDSIIMARFPCLAHARAFWYSKAYQETVKPNRLNPSAGDFLVTVYPELPIPEHMAGRVQPPTYTPSPGPEVAASVPQVPQ